MVGIASDMHHVICIAITHDHVVHLFIYVVCPYKMCIYPLLEHQF